MESMHDEELLYYSLKRIASTICFAKLGSGSAVQKKKHVFPLDYTRLALTLHLETKRPS